MESAKYLYEVRIDMCGHLIPHSHTVAVYQTEAEAEAEAARLSALWYPQRYYVRRYAMTLQSWE
jgi:hypothetical protein